MPPNLLSTRRALSTATSHSLLPLAPFLYPALVQQRYASILSQLSDVPSSYNKRKRVGRGPSSGKGKTSGRGHKGQKQHGKVPAGFNGGQTPDEVVSGKRGFENIFSVDMAPVNLNRIQYWIDQGRIDPTQPITLRELNKSRCIHGVKDGVKLLARGKEELSTPINIVVSRASAEAINTVEKLGGSVTTRYYSKFAIRKILEGQMDPINSLQSRISASPATQEGVDATVQAILEERKRYRYRLPDPAGRKDLEYYRDSAHRGYLSHLVEEGHGPSLYFRTPGVRMASAAKGKGMDPAEIKERASRAAANRIW